MDRININNDLGEAFVQKKREISLNMMKTENIEFAIDSILLRLADVLGIERKKGMWTDLASCLSVEPDDIYRARNRDSIPFRLLEKIILYCEKNSISLDLIFTGREIAKSNNKVDPVQLLETIGWLMIDMEMGKKEFSKVFVFLLQVFNESIESEVIDKEQIKKDIQNYLRIVS